MSAERAVTIYALSDASGIRYVGQTRQTLHARLAQHVNAPFGGAALLAWIAELRGAGLRPEIAPLTVVDAEVADEEERRQIDAHRASGCRLVNGRPGGVVTKRRPAWRTVVNLTAERGAKLERLAQREELPIATVARRLLSDCLDSMQTS